MSEERCLQSLQTAIDLRDVGLLQGSLKMASALQLNAQNHDVIREAQLILGLLEEHHLLLADAMSKRSIALLRIALSQARALGCAEHEDQLDASDLLFELESHAQLATSSELQSTFTPLSPLSALNEQANIALNPIADSRARYEQAQLSPRFERSSKFVDSEVPEDSTFARDRTFQISPISTKDPMLARQPVSPVSQAAAPKQQPSPILMSTPSGMHELETPGCAEPGAPSGPLGPMLRELGFTVPKVHVLPLHERTSCATM